MAKNFLTSTKNKYVKAYNTEDYNFVSALSTTEHGTLATPLANGRSYRTNLIKRNKSGKIDLTKTTAEQLAVLDSFSDAEWESFEKTITQISKIGVKYHKNEDFQASLEKGLYNHLINQSIRNQQITRVEEIIDELIRGKTLSPSTVSWDTISNDITKLTTTVDEYVDGIDRTDLLIIASPYAADLLAKEKGTIFRNEVAIFNTGFKAKESVNGVPVVRCNTLNKFTLGAGTNARKVSYILFDKKTLVVQFESAGEVDQDLGFVKYKGLGWYDLIQRLLESRVIVRTFVTNPGTVSKKTNAA